MTTTLSARLHLMARELEAAALSRHVGQRARRDFAERVAMLREAASLIDGADGPSPSEPIRAADVGVTIDPATGTLKLLLLSDTGIEFATATLTPEGQHQHIDAKAGTADGDRVTVLLALIENYERRRWPIFAAEKTEAALAAAREEQAAAVKLANLGKALLDDANSECSALRDLLKRVGEQFSADIAAEEAAMKEWDAMGGPRWTENHPAMKRLTELRALSREIEQATKGDAK